MPRTMKKDHIALITILLLTITLSFSSDIGRTIAGGAGGKLNEFSTHNLRWGLNEIKAPQAWKTTQGSQKIVVAVIDSGIDRSIEAFSDNLWTNKDELPNDGIDNDGNGYVDDVHGWNFREGSDFAKRSSRLFYHGTFVAGLIASSLNPEQGAGGVAPKIKIMDLQFLDSNGHFYTSDWDKLAEAINYAADNGARIINLSIYASLNPPPSVHRAVKRAERKGVLVVGISGNRRGRVRYISSWDEITTVGAVNRAGRPAEFTNFGPAVDLAAPGEEVLSYKPGGYLASGSGTSFAAPHVAGAAALLLSKNPGLSNREVKEILEETSEDIYEGGWDDKTGHGLIDTDRALQKTISS